MIPYLDSTDPIHAQGVHDAASPPPSAHEGAAVAESCLGLTVADLHTLPERIVADALGLIARTDSPNAALAALDALRQRYGEESLTLADERVTLLLEAGRAAEALDAARTRQARKDSLLAQLHLVRALLTVGAHDEAATVAAAMCAAAPEKVSPLYAAALVALSRRAVGEARRHIEGLLALHPESPTGLRGLARVTLAEGDAAAALDLAEQALDRYTVPPADLLRDLEHYAARCPGAGATRALRRVEEARAALDATVRQRLTEATTTAPAQGERRPTPARRRDSAATHEDEDDLPPSAAPITLPPAPPPDPAQHDRLQALLHQHFGYRTFRTGQEQVIAAVLAGHDTLAVMPTGAGKSLCYQFPAFIQEGLTLVISPLIALMKDQVESLPAALLAQTTLINSSLESAELALRLNAIAAGQYRLVYAAPERLRQRPFIHALRRAGVRLVVIDEAHCLSMWGHDFRPDYLFISVALHDLAHPQVLAMTATATPEMMGEIATQLGRDLCAVNTGVLRDNLSLLARRVDNDDGKLRLLLPFVQGQQGAGIVYVNSRDNAEKIERTLRGSGVNARAYHAGLGTAERSALQDRFMSGNLRVMVATVAFGMGVDKADVRFVVHYNPSRSLEAYAQESGRAGRDGHPAVCLLLHSSSDRTNLNRWSKNDALPIEGLRAVYRVLRSLVAVGRPGLVDAAALREHLEQDGQGTLDLRVALSLLERAALLRRGPDVPRGATLTRHAQTLTTPDPLWERLLAATHLEVERPLPIDLQTLAQDLEIDLVALEDRLLAWQEQRTVSYRGVGREMLIELLPPPPDSAERMAALLDGMGRRNRRRLRSLYTYLDGTQCRHLFIARHFGHDAPPVCTRCEVCRPVALDEWQPVVGTRLDDPAAAVQRLVRQHPLAYGKTGVVEVLKGAEARRMHATRTDLFGALAHLPKAAIERAVEALLAEGVLTVELRNDYRMLRLSEEGDADAATQG